MVKKIKNQKVKFRHPHLVVSVPPVHPDLILGFRSVVGHLPEVPHAVAN